LIALLSTVHVITCIFLILVVLLQQGKGADLSVFGGGGSQAAFGARGATTLLHKLTVIGFVGFILTTMAIGLLKTRDRNESVITDAPIAAPAAAEEAAADSSTAAEQAVPLAVDGTAEMTAAGDAAETTAAGDAAETTTAEDSGDPNDGQ
jgi:preprotein translocase subunit SecG